MTNLTDPHRKKKTFLEFLNQPISLPFGKSKPTPAPEPEPVVAPEPATTPPTTSTEAPAPSRFARLREGLRRTREQLASGLASLFARKAFDQDTIDELESRLLSADVGVDVTNHLIHTLSEQVKHQQVQDMGALLQTLKATLLEMLMPCQQPWQPTEARPYVILMVGVNGSGKTTSIGKLAKRLKDNGYGVLLAAGDTFRAAAVEQLQVWGERNDIPVVAQRTGADAASVTYDAIQSAKAKAIEIVIADTAGRLHTQAGLMDELKKIKRVIGKAEPTAPHEVLLVIDASIGQNALHQAVHFHQAIGVTGLIVTKLDGTAKGGILFAIAQRLKLPIRFVGIGEGIDDLRPFDAAEFVTALLGDMPR